MAIRRRLMDGAAATCLAWRRESTAIARVSERLDRAYLLRRRHESVPWLFLAWDGNLLAD